MAKPLLGFDNKNLVWLDCEMTGLDPDVEKILEIAVVVTDPQLRVRVRGPVFAIRQTEEVLDAMDPWNKRAHGESGLINRSKNSVWDEACAEEEILLFLRQYLEEGKSPMCGNVLCKDRAFLLKYMPQLHHFFRYNDMDVSTFVEAATRWYPDLTLWRKQNAHSAYDDVIESIEMMKYYRGNMLRN